ncbi:GntR family transcriptional regulator [Saccharomonospora sp. NPDC046836]|uniref:GntR family transcriptional regulator n=1 Tax=Saccharomonospora sp. NPDC046836 TaxID=3156921 RepID=UPI0033EDF249
MADGLQTKSVVDAVEEALRHRILVGDEPPGEVVTEIAVASRFRVGRPTAKAAVDRLVADGLLVREGRRGSVVPTVGPDDIVDLYDSRCVIERFAHARLAERAYVPSEATLANVSLRHAASVEDAALAIASDVALHRALVVADGSPRLQRMHSSLLAEAHVCMARVQANQLLRADVIADEHDEILRCIGAGDVAGAALATDRHLTHARDKLRALLDERARENPARDTAPDR